MVNFPFFLAVRYLQEVQQEKSLSTMVKICFLGIAIGTFCLTLVAVIMRGIEQETYKTIQGCHAPLTMHASGNQIAFDAIAKILTTEFPELAYSPVDVQYIMIQDHKNSLSNLVALKGVDPHKEAQTTTLEKKIISSQTDAHTLVDALEDDAVLIGHHCAKMLHLQCGDTFTIYFVPDHEAGNATITLEQATLKVGGIFKTGIEELDANLIVCSLPQLQKLFPNCGITSLHIAYPNTCNEKTVQANLKKRFNLHVHSWKDRYPALVAALTLETYASFIVLTLIILVASMSILSLLFMYITQKRSDIAVLKIVGASNATIRCIFIYMGIIISSSAIIVGLLLAFIVALLLNNFIIIQLPDAYFVSHLPVALEFSIFALVFIIVFIISFFATWLPTRSIKRFNIAQVLRFEG